MLPFLGIEKVADTGSGSFMIVPPGFGHHSKFVLAGVNLLTRARARNPANVVFLLSPHSKDFGNFVRVLCLSKCCGEKIENFRYPGSFQVAIISFNPQL